jgi:hypothetical protein
VPRGTGAAGERPPPRAGPGQQDVASVGPPGGAESRARAATPAEEGEDQPCRRSSQPSPDGEVTPILAPFRFDSADEAVAEGDREHVIAPPAPARARSHEPRDRNAAAHIRSNRRVPPQEHPEQAQPHLTITTRQSRPRARSPRALNPSSLGLRAGSRCPGSISLHPYECRCAKLLRHRFAMPLRAASGLPLERGRF